MVTRLGQLGIVGDTESFPALNSTDYSPKITFAGTHLREEEKHSEQDISLLSHLRGFTVILLGVT